MRAVINVVVVASLFACIDLVITVIYGLRVSATASYCQPLHEPLKKADFRLTWSRVGGLIAAAAHASMMLILAIHSGTTRWNVSMTYCYWISQFLWTTALYSGIVLMTQRMLFVYQSSYSAIAPFRECLDHQLERIIKVLYMVLFFVVVTRISMYIIMIETQNYWVDYITLCMTSVIGSLVLFIQLAVAVSFSYMAHLTQRNAGLTEDSKPTVAKETCKLFVIIFLLTIGVGVLFFSAGFYGSRIKIGSRITHPYDNLVQDRLIIGVGEFYVLLLLFYLTRVRKLNLKEYLWGTVLAKVLASYRVEVEENHRREQAERRQQRIEEHHRKYSKDSYTFTFERKRDSLSQQRPQGHNRSRTWNQGDRVRAISMPIFIPEGVDLHVDVHARKAQKETSNQPMLEQKNSLPLPKLQDDQSSTPSPSSDTKLVSDSDSQTKSKSDSPRNREKKKTGMMKVSIQIPPNVQLDRESVSDFSPTTPADELRDNLDFRRRFTNELLDKTRHRKLIEEIRRPQMERVDSDVDDDMSGFVEFNDERHSALSRQLAKVTIASEASDMAATGLRRTFSEPDLRTKEVMLKDMSRRLYAHKGSNASKCFDEMDFREATLSYLHSNPSLRGYDDIPHEKIARGGHQYGDLGSPSVSIDRIMTSSFPSLMSAPGASSRSDHHEEKPSAFEKFMGVVRPQLRRLKNLGSNSSTRRNGGSSLELDEMPPEFEQKESHDPPPQIREELMYGQPENPWLALQQAQQKREKKNSSHDSKKQSRRGTLTLSVPENAVMAEPMKGLSAPRSFEMIDEIAPGYKRSDSVSTEMSITVEDYQFDPSQPPKMLINDFNTAINNLF